MLLCAVAPLTLHAQSGDVETGEVAAFGGGSFLSGFHPAVGASTGLAFSRYGIALFEVAFSPLGEETVRKRTGPAAEGSRLYDINASFHIRVPVRERWAPYAIIGGGLLFDSFRAVAGGAPQLPPTSGDSTTTPPPSGGLILAIDEFNFGFHTGGGLRYYIGRDWGIRPEMKIIVSNRTYTRFTVGIFYNVSPGWP